MTFKFIRATGVFATAMAMATAMASGPVVAADLIADETAIANGKLRFAQNCNYCHGSNGIGGKHRKLQCRDFQPDYVFDTITYGLESGSFFMPPWDHFSDEQRWELVAFILSLGQLETCE